MTGTRKTEFTLVRRVAQLTPVGEPTTASRLTLLGTRREKTVEGKLHGTLLTRPLFVAALYLVLTAMAETATVGVVAPGPDGWRFLVRPNAALAIGLHALLLVSLVTHASMIRRLNPELARLLVAFGPVPILRIVSLTSPLIQFTSLQWFGVISVILYSGIVTAIKLLQPDLRTIGLRLPAARDLPLEAGVVALGLGFGWLEYRILRPSAFVSKLTLGEVIPAVVVLYVATGLLEELLFRGLLQKYATDALGRGVGIVLVTLTFAVLHAGWQSWLDVLFVGSVGLIYSLVVLRTKSILGVSLSHGITNSMLFIFMPFLAG